MPYGPKRILFEQATEIRRLYNSGEYTQKQLAVQFKVSQSLICKVINNDVHKPQLHIGGEADVKMGFKYGN